MHEEYAQRHCMMVSIEGGEGAPSSARIWYLDWLDANDVPHSEDSARPVRRVQEAGG